jgi:hypothetical protein
LAINSSPTAKQLLKEGESKEKVMRTMISGSDPEMLTDKQRQERDEQISKSIITKARIFDNHAARSSSTSAGLSKKKSAKTQAKGTLPSRDSLLFAKRTVRAEMQPKVEDNPALWRDLSLCAVITPGYGPIIAVVRPRGRC